MVIAIVQAKQPYTGFFLFFSSCGFNASGAGKDRAYGIE